MRAKCRTAYPNCPMMKEKFRNYWGFPPPPMLAQATGAAGFA